MLWNLCNIIEEVTNSFSLIKSQVFFIYLLIFNQLSVKITFEKINI
jgi:hypothetical protein